MIATTAGRDDDPQQAPILVDARQAAAMLAISERTLFALTKSGAIRCKRIGRSVRYNVKSLEAFAQ